MHIFGRVICQVCFSFIMLFMGQIPIIPTVVGSHYIGCVTYPIGALKVINESIRRALYTFTDHLPDWAIVNSTDL